MTALKRYPAPDGPQPHVEPHRIVITFPVGQLDDPAIEASSVTTAELYAAVYLLDLMAHEIRAFQLAQMAQQRAQQTLAVARSMPNGLGH